MLKVKNLHKYYRGLFRKPLHVINNTSLEIPANGIFAVVGASGAGKTTLINTISSLDSFKSGSISFLETEMKRYHSAVADKIRMKNYGFIFQNYYLLETKTVYENVKISLDAFDIDEKEKKRRINYVLNQLGIAKYTNKLVTSLSGGEQQRVSIARALVKSPKIIFADEPTGSLDEKTTFTVLNILKKISKNCAVFIVTHEKDIISYYADYIIEIDNGIKVKEFKPEIKEDSYLAVDQNIYLNELNHIDHHQDDNFTFDVYTDDSKVEKSNIKIAIQNNKIFLESSSDIVFLSNKSENHLIDGNRYKIEDYVKEDFEYDLEPLDNPKSKINFKEMLSQSFKNYKSKSSIKTMLKIVAVLLSVVFIALFESMSTIQNVNLSNDLKHSKGNISFEILPDGPSMNTAKLTQAYQTVLKDVEDSDLDGEILFSPKDQLIYEYEGFMQIKKMKYLIPEHDMKNIDSFATSSLIYGHMPTNGYEIIIDEYVIEHFLNNSILKNIISDYGFFVGKTLSSNNYKYNLTIAGICRTKNPVIYAHKSVNFIRLSYYSQVEAIDIDYAKTIYPSLENVNLSPGHCLRNATAQSGQLNTLIVDGYFNDIPYSYIIHPSDYFAIKNRAASERSDMYFSSNGNSSTINSLINLVNKTKDNLKEKEIDVIINMHNYYQDEYDAATKDFNDILNVVKIITIVVVSIALLLIVLSTYLSMLHQISDIAVYRSIGYSRLYLGLIYFIELAILALLHAFIGGAVAYLSMFILDIIPLIPYTISLSIMNALLIVLIVAAVICVIGIIPIIFVFRLTPAQIYNRYNKRINNV